MGVYTSASGVGVGWGAAPACMCESVGGRGGGEPLGLGLTCSGREGGTPSGTRVRIRLFARFETRAKVCALVGAGYCQAGSDKNASSTVATTRGGAGTTVKMTVKASPSAPTVTADEGTRFTAPATKHVSEMLATPRRPRRSKGRHSGDSGGSRWRPVPALHTCTTIRSVIKKRALPGNTVTEFEFISNVYAGYIII